MRRSFTIWLEEEQVDGVQRLATSLGLSASGILRLAAEAVIADPALLLRPAPSYTRQQPSEAKQASA